MSEPSAICGTVQNRRLKMFRNSARTTSCTSLFFNREGSPECHAFSRLPLPAEVIEASRGCTEGRLNPRRPIQQQLRRWIELGVWIHQEKEADPVPGS
jgi:hypothetical protein